MQSLDLGLERILKSWSWSCRLGLEKSLDYITGEKWSVASAPLAFIGISQVSQLKVKVACRSRLLPLAELYINNIT